MGLLINRFKLQICIFMSRNVNFLFKVKPSAVIKYFTFEFVGHYLINYKLDIIIT